MFKKSLTICLWQDCEKYPYLLLDRSCHVNKGDIEKHIGDLKKTSVRGKLQEAKETVAPPSEKHVRKGEPSL